MLLLSPQHTHTQNQQDPRRAVEMMDIYITLIIMIGSRMYAYI